MTREYPVAKDQAGQRLDLFLVGQEPSRTRAFFQKLIERGRVRRDASFLKSRYPVKAGDCISVEFPEEHPSLKSEAVPLKVLYEDDAILVLDKPAGMVVHPNEVEQTGTLVQALLGYYPKLALALYDKDSPVSQLRPGIVHRLDKDTSGVMVVAKTAEALQDLAAQFKEHATRKEYLAIVFGAVREAQTVHTTMARKAGRRNLMGAKGLDEEGREAITHLEPTTGVLLSSGQAVTLLRCRIETGRTHQIRVHCKHIGHPVLGDELYGHKSSLALSRKLGIGRQMLHAARLSFRHPTSQLETTVEAALPADMQALLAALDKPLPTW